MTTFSDKTQALLAQVNQVYPGTVMLRASGDATGVLKHDQAATEIFGSRLMIEVTDTTAPDVVATHELLHMMLTLNGYPQEFFQLEAATEALTEQMMVMATYLYQPAMHAIIYREQIRQGVMTLADVEAYTKGVMQELTPEADGDHAETALRTMLLLDAQVLMTTMPEDTTKYTDTLAELYPVAWQAATVIFKMMKVDEIKDPFTMHRAITEAFKGFDQQMAKLNLPELSAGEFVTVTPVLSERQLRLQVRQVYEIKHTVYTDRNTKMAAYVGLGKSDQQNAFVLPQITELTPEMATEMYDLTVEELFNKLNQPYTLRG